MGRALLLIVAGLSVAGSAYAVLGSDTQTESARRQASSQEITLARQAAQSGLEVGLGALAADFDARPSADRQPLDASGAHGTYSLETTDTAQATVGIEARGYVGAAEHVVTAEVLELLPIGAALTVQAEGVKLELKDNGHIDGTDRRAGALDHQAGPAGGNAGVRVSAADVAVEWKGAGTANVTGDPATSTGPTPRVVREIVEAALAAGPTITAATYTLKKDQVGTPLAPVVVHATDKAALQEGAVGYGLLIVDGDFKMEKDARWEGLIVVRAESADKRKVELKDDAEIVGALVLLGAEYTAESGGDDGFPGGHMDLDIFEGTGAPLDRSYHQHEWDDRYDLTYIDFFTAPDIGDSFQDFLAANVHKTLTVRFDNAFNSAGTYTITQGATSAAGRTEDGFTGAVDMGALTAFRVSFDALCSLRGTSPGRVKDDGSNRDRSFTVRFFDGPTLVYAVSAYEHAKELRDGDPLCATSGTGTGTPAEDTAVYGRFEVKVENRAAVSYSEEAAGRIGRALSVARDQTRKLPLIIRSVPTE